MIGEEVQHQVLLRCLDSIWMTMDWDCSSSVLENLGIKVFGSYSSSYRTPALLLGIFTFPRVSDGAWWKRWTAEGKTESEKELGYWSTTSRSEDCALLLLAIVMMFTLTKDRRRRCSRAFDWVRGACPRAFSVHAVWKRQVWNRQSWKNL